MLNCELTRQDLFLKDDSKALHEVSGIIGLSGKAKGTVVLSLYREAALRATEVMLQVRPDSINSDVTDAIGELTNMIAGAAKAQLEQYELSITLSTVITGKGHSIGFPSGAPALYIPFECEWGGVVVQVGYVGQPNQMAEPAVM